MYTFCPFKSGLEKYRSHVASLLTAATPDERAALGRAIREIDTALGKANRQGRLEASAANPAFAAVTNLVQTYPHFELPSRKEVSEPPT